MPEVYHCPTCGARCYPGTVYADGAGYVAVECQCGLAANPEVDKPCNRRFRVHLEGLCLDDKCGTDAGMDQVCLARNV